MFSSFPMFYSEKGMSVYDNKSELLHTASMTLFKKLYAKFF